MASQQDELEEALAPFLTVQAVIVLPIATLSVSHPVFSVIYKLPYMSGLPAHIPDLCLYVASEAYGIVRQAVIEFDAAKMQDLEPFARYAVQGDSGETFWA
ncbi:hypothetical protein PQX77_018377 [Marasmius sp. AFHP31]|nr:hypothetical protein PQX77_018377 [Marasmius sp. AFHP31]